MKLQIKVNEKGVIEVQSLNFWCETLQVRYEWVKEKIETNEIKTLKALALHL